MISGPVLLLDRAQAYLDRADRIPDPERAARYRAIAHDLRLEALEILEDRQDKLKRSRLSTE